MVPVYVFTPAKFKVPVPDFITLVLPLITPETVDDEAPTLVISRKSKLVTFPEIVTAPVPEVILRSASSDCW